MESWVDEYPEHGAFQNNGFDCGVFVCGFASYIANRSQSLFTCRCDAFFSVFSLRSHVGIKGFETLFLSCRNICCSFSHNRLCFRTRVRQRFVQVFLNFLCLNCKAVISAYVTRTLMRRVLPLTLCV